MVTANDSQGAPNGPPDLDRRTPSRHLRTGCSDPRHPHHGQHLICRRCGSVTEIADAAILGAVRDGAAAVGFTVEGQTIEISGVCAACAAERPNERPKPAA